jgi:hypothetical protein
VFQVFKTFVDKGVVEEKKGCKNGDFRVKDRKFQ